VEVLIGRNSHDKLQTKVFLLKIIHRRLIVETSTEKHNNKNIFFIINIIEIYPFLIISYQRAVLQLLALN